MREFTETALEQEGWYFFYPKYSYFQTPSFMFVDKSVIKEEALFCRAYAGIYIGPFEIPEPSGMLQSEI